MASQTRSAWIWVNSRSLWWTGRPGILWFMGSQSQTRLSDWTDWLTDRLFLPKRRKVALPSNFYMLPYENVLLGALKSFCKELDLDLSYCNAKLIRPIVTQLSTFCNVKYVDAFFCVCKSTRKAKHILNDTVPIPHC